MLSAALRKLMMWVNVPPQKIIRTALLEAGKVEGTTAKRRRESVNLSSKPTRRYINMSQMHTEYNSKMKEGFTLHLTKPVSSFLTKGTLMGFRLFFPAPKDFRLFPSHAKDKRPLSKIQWRFIFPHKMAVTLKHEPEAALKASQYRE
jgi:hypothetical protein